MKTNTQLLPAILMATASIGVSAVHASVYDANPTLDKVAEEEVYSPYVNRGYPDQVLFGDTHFHTELSFDAGMIGTRLDVDAGYRFARGEKVISNTVGHFCYEIGSSRSNNNQIRLLTPGDVFHARSFLAKHIAYDFAP